MGTILPDGQSHEMQVINYNSNDLKNQADAKEVTTGPGGILVTQDRIQISDPGTPQQSVERGYDAKVAVDIQPQQFKMEYPDEALASQADVSSFISAFFPDMIASTAQDDLTSNIDTSSPKLESGISSEDATNQLNIQSSTDQVAILASLVSMSGIDSDPTIAPAQKTKIQQALNALASAIAEKNTSGGVPELNAFSSTTVAEALKTILAGTTTGLSGSDLQLMEDTILPHIASSLSSLNATSGEAPPSNALFDTLTTSTDASQILQALKAQVDVSKLDPEAVKKLSDLAQAIASRNSDPETQGTGGIESADPQTVETLLTNLLGVDQDTSLSPEMKTSLRLVASNLATSIATNNEAKWMQDTYSSDRSVVQKALVALSNVKYDPTLSDQEKVATQDYLKILSMVLAFMTEIRAKIAQLESTLQKAESQGKLSNIKDQTTIALKNYEKNMHEIHAMLKKMEKSKQTGLIMKIIMPIVQAIMMVITIVIAVVSFAISVATAGTATPAAIALVTIMITLTIGMTATSVALTSSDAIEKLCAAISVTNPVLKATIGMVIELVMTSILVVVSCGTALASAAAKAALSTAQKAIESAVKVTMDAIKEAVKAAIKEALLTLVKNPAVYMTIGGGVVNSVFSSGMVTQSATALFKACGLKDKDAELASMILTMLLMITMILALLATAAPQAIKGMAGAAKGLTSMVKNTATAATKGAVELTDDAAEAGTDAATSATKAAGGAVAGAADDAISLTADEADTTMFTNTLNTLAKQSHTLMDNKTSGLIMNMITNVAIPGAEAVAQILPQILQIESNVKQAQLTKVQIGLTRDLAHGQALIEFLKGVLPSFDVTLDALQEDSRGHAQFMSSLFSLFKSMVDQASTSLDASLQTV